MEMALNRGLWSGCAVNLNRFQLDRLTGNMVTVPGFPDVRKEEEKPGNMLSRVFGFYTIDGLALGFLAFQVAGALIHPLLIVAVVCLIIHFVRGRSGV